MGYNKDTEERNKTDMAYKKIVVKDYENFPHIVKAVKALKRFCTDMGYTYHTEYFTHCSTHEKCFSFEINETCDSEGNPYAWAWSMETGKEL